MTLSIMPALIVAYFALAAENDGQRTPAVILGLLSAISYCL